MAMPHFDPSDVVDFWDLTNRQDWHVNELTQLGLSSRAYSPGPYSNAEGLLSAFDRHYLRGDGRPKATLGLLLAAGFALPSLAESRTGATSGRR